MLAKNYVIAIDIGTTTISFALINVETRKTENTHVLLNSQAKYGIDVVTRIQNANNGKLSLLSAAVKDDFKKGIQILTRDARTINKIAITANTAMIHFLTETSCKELAVYPFTTKIKDSIIMNCQEIIEDAEVIILPCQSAFLGADIMAGIYYTDLYQHDSISLLIDIGTNAEIVMGNKHKILCTSAAAGPAFEGGTIKHGVGAVEGAIFAAKYINGKFEYKTIADALPVGICGTGIVDIIAQGLENNLIDCTGLIKKGELEIDKTSPIVLTQKDIRCVQLAKSAVCTAIEILIEDSSQIDNVYIAGGFGHELNIKNATKIKLLPDGLENKIKIIGNSSLEGAKKFLVEKDGMDHLNKIKMITTEINLPLTEHFNDLFIKHLNF